MKLTGTPIQFLFYRIILNAFDGTTIENNTQQKPRTHVQLKFLIYFSNTVCYTKLFNMTSTSQLPGLLDHVDQLLEF